MQYNELPAEQQQALDGLLDILRPSAVTFAQQAHTAKVVTMGISETTSVILPQLDIDAEIPNRTGLAGAQSLTRADVEVLVAALQQVADTYDTDEDLALFVKAAGMNALFNQG